MKNKKNPPNFCLRRAWGESSSSVGSMKRKHLLPPWKLATFLERRVGDRWRFTPELLKSYDGGVCCVEKEKELTWPIGYLNGNWVFWGDTYDGCIAQSKESQSPLMGKIKPGERVNCSLTINIPYHLLPLSVKRTVRLIDKATREPPHLLMNPTMITASASVRVHGTLPPVGKRSIFPAFPLPVLVPSRTQFRTPCPALAARQHPPLSWAPLNILFGSDRPTPSLSRTQLKQHVRRPVE